MNIRVMGTADELIEATTIIKKDFEVLSISKPYRNRNDDLFRVYIDAIMKKGDDE